MSFLVDEINKNIKQLRINYKKLFVESCVFFAAIFTLEQFIDFHHIYNLSNVASALIILSLAVIFFFSKLLYAKLSLYKQLEGNVHGLIDEYERVVNKHSAMLRENSGVREDNKLLEEKLKIVEYQFRLQDIIIQQYLSLLAQLGLTDTFEKRINDIKQFIKGG
jgi:hypothetical protein